MVVVVLRDEEQVIDEPNGDAEPGMLRGADEVVRRETIHLREPRQARRSELCQEVVERPGVVVRLVGLPVLHVGGRQRLRTGDELIHPCLPEFLEVEQVPHVLLDRPRAAELHGQHSLRQIARHVIQPRGCPAQARPLVRMEFRGQRELKTPIDPSS
jgi:hypothetical protein